MRRDWISVAKSIWDITDKSKKPIRWYGASGAKWHALTASTNLLNINDIFVRATIEWILSEQAYEKAIE